MRGQNLKVKDLGTSSTDAVRDTFVQELTILAERLLKKQSSKEYSAGRTNNNDNNNDKHT